MKVWRVLEARCSKKEVSGKTDAGIEKRRGLIPFKEVVNMERILWKSNEGEEAVNFCSKQRIENMRHSCSQ